MTLTRQHRGRRAADRFRACAVFLSPIIVTVLHIVFYYPEDMFTDGLSDAEQMKQFSLLLDTVAAFVFAPFLTNQILSKILTGKLPPPEEGRVPAVTKINLYAFIGVFQVAIHSGADPGIPFSLPSVATGLLLLVSAVWIWRREKRREKQEHSPCAEK